MHAQPTVYENTWYLPASKSWSHHDRIVPDTSPKDSPFICDFGEIRIPVFDYLSSGPSRTAVRVVIHDNPEFFCALAQSDRQLLLLQFAHVLIAMLRDGLSHFQFGFSVEVLNMDWNCALQYPHVEYYCTLIASTMESNEPQSRYIANICSGAPAKKIRRAFDKIDDLARRVERRLAGEDSLEEDP